MDFNFVTHIKICYDMVRDFVPVSMVYYSHIPSAVAALLIGSFVILKNRKITGWIVFLISVTFSFWSFIDIILWTSYNSEFYMFFWSIIVIFEAILFVLNIYLISVFSDSRDVSFWNKITWLLLLLPILILVPTRLNMGYFDLTNCMPISNILYEYYAMPLYGLLLVWFIIVASIKLKKSTPENKKQVVLISLGSFFFLFTFFASNLLTDYLMNNEILSVVDSYKIEMYGLFTMPIFLGILAYLIVRYKAFEIKLIGAQALVVTLVVIIGSQFAFIVSVTNKILTAITLTIAVIFGWILVRSVKREVKQREELEIANGEIEKRNDEILDRNKKLKKANKEISERKEQLQKISDSLAIANDKLQKLDMAKTEFVSMASHQLRTPPTPIKGYSSMLLEGSYGELNAEQRKAIENISNANNQQIAFVEDLLSVSRIESGSLKFQFEKCHIEEFCQEVVDNLVLKAKDKNLYLDYKAPATPLPEITIDGAKVREVISNLVDNAIKYTLKGGVTLYVELCAKKEPTCLGKPHLRITISDTGIGIPAEEIPYLFVKFSRGKDTNRLNTGGTGLGLYVVKIITEANGGKVWIESPGAGRGTKFILELPLEPEKETLERNG
jgi:signal transduction histidine kinase